MSAAMRSVRARRFAAHWHGLGRGYAGAELRYGAPAPAQVGLRLASADADCCLCGTAGRPRNGRDSPPSEPGYPTH